VTLKIGGDLKVLFPAGTAILAIFISTFSGPSFAQSGCDCANPLPIAACMVCVSNLNVGNPPSSTAPNASAPSAPSTPAAPSDLKLQVQVKELNALGIAGDAFAGTAGALAARLAVKGLEAAGEALFKKMGHPLSQKDKVTKEQELAQYQKDMEDFKKFNEDSLKAAKTLIIGLAALQYRKEHDQNSDDISADNAELKLKVDTQIAELDAAVRTARKMEDINEKTSGLNHYVHEALFSEKKKILESYRDNLSEVGPKVCEELTEQYQKLAKANRNMSEIVVGVLQREDRYWDYRKDQLKRLNKTMAAVASNDHSKKVTKAMEGATKAQEKLDKDSIGRSLKRLIKLCEEDLKASTKGLYSVKDRSIQESCREFVGSAARRNPEKLDDVLQKLSTAGAQSAGEKLKKVDFYSLKLAEAQQNSASSKVILSEAVQKRRDTLKEAALSMGLYSGIETAGLVADADELDKISFIDTMPALREKVRFMTMVHDGIQEKCTDTATTPSQRQEGNASSSAK